ncbi:Phosphoserine phosphatase [Burkholderia multivorans]|nr:Phosphoserine phosphatase [Burkholderia multivorans]MDR8926204.1 Phosphoserine phosphatase [Burkholderia multivorans]MDR8968403.1 Phosphoserine phosphatase [Burkholderia multivorans]MDR8992567.1 Phosphoserine phosphatase [Burkholderia multivorans]MDR9023504.1 Phosphoserine phosphatase [Burkholderia multivorans]
MPAAHAFDSLPNHPVMSQNLVIQSVAPLSNAHHKPLLALSRGTRIVQTDDCALRVEGADPAQRGDLAVYCGTHALDFAFVDAGRTLRDFGLVVMDMDSTLITIECIDEIADFCGLKDQVAAITEASMRGEIRDFNESLTRRVALLAGLDAHALERVYEERLQLSPGAETMLAGVKAAGLKTLLVSGGFTFFTERLKARLGLDYTHANTLEIVDGKLTGKVLGEIVNADVKARMLRDTCASLGIAPSRAIAMGDGSNDLKMMAEAGLSVAFHAKPVVRDAAKVAFDHVGLDGLLRLF